MADQKDIDAVLDVIPSDAVESGWTPDKIADYLDSGKKLARIASMYWEKIASDTYKFVSISESGSSRDLRTIHTNAVAMAKLWGDRAQAEETPVVPVVPVKAGVVLHTMNRI